METKLIFIFITLLFAWYNGVFNLWGWVATILLWHCFDIIINLTREQGVFYSGTVSEFDKRSKLTLIAKIVFLLAGILFLF